LFFLWKFYDYVDVVFVCSCSFCLGWRRGLVAGPGEDPGYRPENEEYG
jgi:hypothetical protein